MENNEFLVDQEGSAIQNALETTEIVGVSEQLFNRRLDSLENLFVVQVIGLGLIAGCLIATLIMRFFDVR